MHYHTLCTSWLFLPRNSPVSWAYEVPLLWSKGSRVTAEQAFVRLLRKWYINLSSSEPNTHLPIIIIIWRLSYFDPVLLIWIVGQYMLPSKATMGAIAFLFASLSFTRNHTVAPVASYYSPIACLDSWTSLPCSCVRVGYWEFYLVQP